MEDKKGSKFQRRATESGHAFANECRIILEGMGFGLLGKRKFKEAGVEVDQAAKNNVGESLYFEFKGSYLGKRPGLRRTDTVKKVVCDAFLVNKIGHGPYIVVTSHKPEEGTSAYAMLECAKEVIFDVIAIHDGDDMARLETYLGGLPWRSDIVAKSQTRKADSQEVVTQRSLFGIRVLQPFSKVGEDKKSKIPRKRASR